MTWRLKTNPDDTVDELVMQGAYVHFEDLGNAYMLIVENNNQHIHLTIPARSRGKNPARAFVCEQFDPRATRSDVAAAAKALYLDHATDDWGKTAPEIAAECERVARLILLAAANTRETET